MKEEEEEEMRRLIFHIFAKAKTKTLSYLKHNKKGIVIDQLDELFWFPYNDLESE